MGIRYLAIAIDEADYAHLAKGPCPTCGERPHIRELDYDDEERDVLDLDKAWSHFQRLFELNDRVALELVAGRVTDTPRGWISHQGLLSPEAVSLVARDLATVTSEDVREFLARRPSWGSSDEDRDRQDFGYLVEYLERAKVFTARAADQQRAITYFIG